MQRRVAGLHELLRDAPGRDAPKRPSVTRWPADLRVREMPGDVK